MCVRYSSSSMPVLTLNTSSLTLKCQFYSSGCRFEIKNRSTQSESGIHRLLLITGVSEVSRVLVRARSCGTEKRRRGRGTKERKE